MPTLEDLQSMLEGILYNLYGQILAGGPSSDDRRECAGKRAHSRNLS